MEKTALANKQFPISLNEISDFPTIIEFDDEQPQEEVVEILTMDDEGNNEENNSELSEETAEPVEDDVVFKLNIVPGAFDDDVIEIEDEPIEMDEKTQTPLDSWDWEGKGGPAKFLNWLQTMFSSIPKHSGQDTTGVERALAYFQRLDTEISRAMRKDYKRDIDAAKAEQARTEIENGMERLVERLEKLREKKFKRHNKKKKADIALGIVKSADTSTTGKIVVTVPYLISNIARACIESTVQAGRDVEDSFDELAKEYKLDNREKFLVAQLIKDMGYPILLDRINFGKDSIRPTENHLSEYMQQFYA